MLVALLAAAAALLGGASRSEAAVIHANPGYSASFGLDGKEGGRVQVLTIGHRVLIDAMRRPLWPVQRYTTYAVSGSVSSDRVAANLGRFGSLSVEFRRTGEPERTPPPTKCVGKDELSWQGVFVGAVSFHPERGWLRIRRRRIRSTGTMSYPPRWHCPSPKPHGPRGPTHSNGVSLLASDCAGRTFSALGERPGREAAGSENERHVQFSVSWTRRVGRVQITDQVTLLDPRGGLRFDESLTTATVEPPPPFYGTATLVRDLSGATHWSGTLEVSFFGREVALAGTAFRSSLESFPLPYPIGKETAYAVFVDFEGCGRAN